MGDLHENEIGGYNYHDMPAVLNDVFRFEEQTMVDDPNVYVEAFCNMLQLA